MLIRPSTTLIAGLLLIACILAVYYRPHPVSPPRHARHAQSWDQENLKRTDSGCPTAIFIAPGGVLEQCR